MAKQVLSHGSAGETQCLSQMKWLSVETSHRHFDKFCSLILGPARNKRLWGKRCQFVQGHKLKSVSMELAAQRKNKKAQAAVAQTTDVVASHTGDKWTENAGGLYPYLKTKRGAVNKGPDNIHTAVQLPAPAGNASGGVELSKNATRSGPANGNVDGGRSNGVTLV